MNKAAVLVIMITYFMLAAVPTEASLQDEIDDMFSRFGFKEHSTAPGAYSAQTRGMIVGGSLNARATTSSINLFSIKPPGIKASCGGLDMYFGGLSFINAEEFREMLQSIGQNALGYAFELGLEAVCPTCNSVLKDLKNWVAQMNKLKTDSCTAAKQLVAWTGESLAENAINSCIESLMAKGSSPGEARKQCLDTNKVSSEILALRDEAHAAGKLPPVVEPGNVTWKALTYTDLSEEDRKIAMNLTGTYVRKMGDSNSSVLEWHGPRLTLRDVMYGRPNAEIIVPAEGDEEEVVIEKTDIEGFKPRVIEKLNSIIPKLQASTALDDEEKNFVNASQIPVRKLAEITRGTPGLQNAAFDLVTDLIVVDMAMTTIMKYVSYVELNVGKQAVVDRDRMLDRIDSVKQDLHAQLKRQLDSFETAARSYELTEFFDKQVGKYTIRQLNKAAQR